MTKTHEAQLNDGRELGDIAVIVRNGGQLSQLQRYLSGPGIPVRIPVAESAVRDEVAVRVDADGGDADLFRGEASGLGEGTMMVGAQGTLW